MVINFLSSGLFIQQPLISDWTVQRRAMLTNSPICHDACPRGAFKRTGTFTRKLCSLENDKRDAEAEMTDGSIIGIDEPSSVTKPFRFASLLVLLHRVLFDRDWV